MVVAVGCCSWFLAFCNERTAGRGRIDRGREGGRGRGKREEELSAAVASMEEEKKIFDLKEVAEHKAQDDCWMVIHGKVKKLFKYVDRSVFLLLPFEASWHKHTL